MANKFVIYSGSTINLVPTNFYLKNQKYKNLFGYAKNIKEANELFEKAIGDEKWVHLVCLNTFDIIKSYSSYDINKNLNCGYDSDEYYN
jgi:hypothetical protein